LPPTESDDTGGIGHRVRGVCPAPHHAAAI